MSEWVQDALQGKFKEVFVSPECFSGLATSRCDEVVAELTGRIRRWCYERLLVPNNSLDIVASLALHMAASGTAAGPEFGHALVQRARNIDTAEGLMGLVAAAEQVIAYLGDSALPPIAIDTARIDSVP